MLGWSGVLVVLALIFIVRPLEIFFTTIGSDLHLKEKAFLSYICPRGIVAASVASLFAIELEKRGLYWGDEVQGLVFLTIGISVLFQGLTANSVAGMLGVVVKNQKAVIVGANSFGRLIGRLVRVNGKEVSFIDTNENLVRIAYTEGFEAVEGDSLDIDKLEETGITEADTVLAVTTSNKVNILVSRLAKVDFEIKAPLPVVNQIDGKMDKETILKLGLDIAFGKPLNMYEVNYKISHREYTVFECSLDSTLIGKKIEELSLSQDVIPALLVRGKSRVPILCRGKLSIEKGDKIVLVDLGDNLGSLEGAGLKDYTPINV